MPPAPAPAPPPPLSKPPITHVYTRRPRHPIDIPPSSALPSTSPDAPVITDTNNIDESHAISDESQVGPRYNFRDRSTIEPPDKLGFPRAAAVINEPSNYHEASGIPEWQLAMAEELAAFDRTSTWILFPYHLMQYLLPANGFLKLRPNQMDLLQGIKLVLLLEVFSRLGAKIMMRLLLLLLTWLQFVL